MEEQKSIIDKGGTMRLGGYKCLIKKNSKTFEAYKKEEIVERHRHRYEFNNKYLEDFRKNGMKPVGVNPESDLVEIIEIPSHKWFVGVQFHPEYSSTVINPHPLFVHFIRACIS
jgi:CTP synthase